jgi:FAD/FMN-containing dehydrogenase
MVNLAALYERPDQAAVYEPWVTGFAAAVEQSDGGAYVNFLVDEGDARIRAAYPGKTWDRLRAIKRRYDPTNLFRICQNVPPAAEKRS